MHIYIEKSVFFFSSATDKFSMSVLDFTDRNPEAQRPGAGDSQRPDQAPLTHQT